MTLLQIEYFIKTVEAGSISKAAAELYISQSAISRSIAELERECGTRLLFREKTISLTGAGEQFLKHAYKVSRSVTELSEAISEYKQKNCGSLRISYHHLDSVISPFLLGWLKRLSEKIPNATIYMRDYSSVKESLLGRQPVCDLVFTLIYDVRPHKNICYRIISSDPVMVIFPASHPLAKLDEIRMQDVANYEVLLPYSGHEISVTDDPICRCFVNHGISFNSVKTISSFNQLTPLIIVNNVVSLVPNSMVDHFHLSDTPFLCCRPVVDCDAGLDVVAAWRKNDTNPILELFISELEHTLENNPPKQP